MCVRLFIFLLFFLTPTLRVISVFEDLCKKKKKRFRYRKGFTWYIQFSVDNFVWELTDVIFHIKVGVVMLSLSSNTFTRSD